MAKAAVLLTLLLLGLTWASAEVPPADDPAPPADDAAPAAADAAPAAAAAADHEHEHQFNKTEDCVLDADVGPCKEALPRFFYNSTTHHCEEFTYGGCQGNHNNFESEKDCMDKCHDDDHPHVDPRSAGVSVGAHATDGATVTVDALAGDGAGVGVGAHTPDGSHVAVDALASDGAKIDVKVSTGDAKVDVQAEG